MRTIVADIVDDMFVIPTQAEIDALAAQARDVTPFSLSDLNPLNTIQVLRDAFGGLEIPGALTLGPLDAIPAGCDRYRLYLYWRIHTCANGVAKACKREVVRGRWRGAVPFGGLHAARCPIPYGDAYDGVGRRAGTHRRGC